MASSSNKNENNQSSANTKLSQFHPRNADQTSSQNMIPPSPGKPNKQTSSADDDGNNDNSNSQSNNEKVSNKTSGRWTKDEHKKFIEGIQKYGRNWKKVEEHIGTRTGAQIRSHAQKFFNRLEKESQNNAKVSDQSRQLLEIMNNSSHHHSSGTQNAASSTPSSTGKQNNAVATNQSAATAATTPSIQQTPQQEKEKKPSVSQANTNTSSTHVQNAITDSPNSIRPSSAGQQNPLNTSSISLGNNDNFTTNTNNYKKIQDNLDLQKPPSSINNNSNSNKYQNIDDYIIHDYLKDDSNETLDYNGNSLSNNQLKMLYEQAIKVPSYNQQSHHQAYFPSKFSNSHGNLSSSYNNNSNHSSHNSHISHNSHGSPQPYGNYYNNSLNNNNYNNSLNYGYSHNQQGYGSSTNNTSNHHHYSYQQMKNFYDERDSEEIMEKYTRQIQENSAQENSFFIEHHLADIEKPKLYDLCALGQQDLSSSQQNYQSEIYVPNFKKGRSRFGSFKLHDEDNETSNQKYQNFRKASIDDQELKKKLKLNDGTPSFVNSNKLSPDSQVLN